MPRQNKRHRTTPDPAARRVGERVRQLRKEAEFTFDAFVEELGLGRGYLSELERGLVVPSLTALSRLAEALDLTVADLVLGNSQRERLFGVTRHLTDADVRRLLETALQLEASGDPKAARIRAPAAGPAERFRTALPLFRIRPAAGPFSEAQEGGIQAWVRPGPRVPIKRGLFLARVVGRSMEPAIADGALCLFRRPWPMPQPGEVGIFVRHEAGDPPTTGRYTVKEYRPQAVDQDGERLVGGSLRPRNRAFPALSAAEPDRERPFARFVQVVG